MWLNTRCFWLTLELVQPGIVLHLPHLSPFPVLSPRLPVCSEQMGKTWSLSFSKRLGKH